MVRRGVTDAFSISTTNIYAEIELTLKTNAVALCEVGEQRPGRPCKGADSRALWLFGVQQPRREVNAPDVVLAVVPRGHIAKDPVCVAERNRLLHRR
jgi:hypothetical protein